MRAIELVSEIRLRLMSGFQSQETVFSLNGESESRLKVAFPQFYLSNRFRGLFWKNKKKIRDIIGARLKNFLKHFQEHNIDRKVWKLS